MFPLFQVSLQGLKPLSSYSLLLEFKLADSHRWRFLNGEWQSIGGATSLYEQQLPEQRTVFIHPASPQTGRQWMKEKINFSKLKLSNKEDGKGKVCVYNYVCKYVTFQTRKIHGKIHGKGEVCACVQVCMLL